MVPKFQSLFPVLKERTEKELIREIGEDTDSLIGLPYPYVTPGVDKRDALYYLDTYFINLGLLKLKLVNLARHQVENLVVLQRRFGYVPASNLKSMTHTSSLPLLPWMVRDVYRATGDKEWLSRILADVIKEFQHWTSAPHVTPSGLYRFYDHGQGQIEARDSGCGLPSRRFKQAENYNPVDLNALLYRNAKLIYDLQVEADGSGDQQLLTKAESIKKLFHLLWNPQEQYYFDHQFVDRQFYPLKSIAGFMPLFVEMADEKNAAHMQLHIKDFLARGGAAFTKQDHGDQNSAWNYPFVCAPYIYFTVKGLIDYEFMEDAADIGENWLQMVYTLYQQTGNMWEWYNVVDASTSTTAAITNSATLGATAGAFIALVDTLGLE